jgi:hypothetical protein
MIEQTMLKKTISIKRKTIPDDYSAFLKTTNNAISYDTAINKIIQLTNMLYDKPYFDMTLVPTNEIIEEKISKFSTDGVRSRMAFVLYSLLSFYGVVNKFVYDLGNSYLKSVNTNNLIDPEKTILYKDISIKRNEIVSKFLILSDKDNVSGRTMYLHCLLLSFYSYSTYRISNFENVVFTDDGSTNFINLETNEITFYKYKTEAFYGKNTFTVNPDLISFISKYHPICFPNSKYLFPCINDSSLSQTGHKSGSLTKFLYRMNQKYFGKSFGCNTIRKSQVSEELENGASVLTIISNAEKAQHSVSTRLTTYSKHSSKFNTDSPTYLSLIADRNTFPKQDLEQGLENPVRK